MCNHTSSVAKSEIKVDAVIWRKPTDHTSNCYFCLVPAIDKGLSKKKKASVQYPNISSALRPVPHGEGLPVPEPPDSFSLESDEEQQEDESTETETELAISLQDPDFLPSSSSEPHFITQAELNDLVRDLQLPKNKAELLGSRLQQWNLLDRGVKVSVFRDRQKALVPFFFMEGDLVECCDVDGLMMSTLNIVHDPHEWRLCIDSSKTSLKAVLLHNGNLLPSVPVGHSVHLKETYDNLKKLLKCINYEQHQWPLCGNLHCYLVFRVATRNIVVLSANGTVVHELFIMSDRTGLCDSHLNLDRKVFSILRLFNPRKSCCHHCISS